ncbi:hypothetical protein X946_4881 [Burkholderia sp. ABCPW 111]|nr:hypothetical protein X946_4881 [Burkholderia sp. ABCPW 111]
MTVARVTPGMCDSAFSTRPAHDAHVMPSMSNSNVLAAAPCVAGATVAVVSSVASAVGDAGECAASSSKHAGGVGEASACALRTTSARYPACSTAATSVRGSASRAMPTVARAVARSAVAAVTPRTFRSACSTRRAQPPQVIPPTVSVTVAVHVAMASPSPACAPSRCVSASRRAAGGVATVARYPAAPSASMRRGASTAGVASTVAVPASRSTVAPVTPGTRASAFSTRAVQPPQCMPSTNSVVVTDGAGTSRFVICHPIR